MRRAMGTPVARRRQAWPPARPEHHEQHRITVALLSSSSPSSVEGRPGRQTAEQLVDRPVCDGRRRGGHEHDDRQQGHDALTLSTRPGCREASARFWDRHGHSAPGEGGARRRSSTAWSHAGVVRRCVEGREVSAVPPDDQHDPRNSLTHRSAGATRLIEQASQQLYHDADEEQPDDPAGQVRRAVAARSTREQHQDDGDDGDGLMAMPTAYGSICPITGTHALPCRTATRYRPPPAAAASPAT